MINTNCPNCPNCQIWKIGSLQPPLPSPRPILRSSSAAARQRCRPEITISDGKWGAILELLAAITGVFNITDEEALEVVVNETDKLARICELYRYKMASKELPKLKEKTKSSRRNSKCASLWESVDRGLGGAEYVILRGGFSLEEGNSFSFAQISLLLFVKFAEFVFDKTVNLNSCSQNPHRLNMCLLQSIS